MKATMVDKHRTFKVSSSWRTPTLLLCIGTSTHDGGKLHNFFRSLKFTSSSLTVVLHKGIADNEQNRTSCKKNEKGKSYNSRERIIVLLLTLFSFLFFDGGGSVVGFQIYVFFWFD
jgi:hypothetical protein